MDSLLIYMRIKDKILLSSVSPEHTLLTSMSVWSKWRPYSLGASPDTDSILIATSCPLWAISTGLWLASTLEITPKSRHYGKPMLNIFFTNFYTCTFLLGTMIGVPGFTSPPSTVTPITIGSLALNTQSGRIRSLQGNTAIFLYSSLFLSFNSYAVSVYSGTPLRRKIYPL